jgi:regulator of sigma E protease
VTSFLAFIFVLGVLVFVHELGHFLAARRIGVRVLTFSLGFGPKILSFKRGDTEYCVSAIPLGGYVKMAGENPDDARTGAADEFLSKSKWERFQVLIMGPVMNLVLAIVVMALVLYQGAPQAAFSSRPPVIGSVESGSVAESAGIRPGDLVVSVDGREVETWDRFAMAIGTKANRQVSLVLVRHGKPLNLQLTPRPVDKFETGQIGVGPERRPQVAGLESGGPAEQAGLRTGDVIIAANGVAVSTDTRFIEIIEAQGTRPLAIDIERDGQRQTITLTPRIEAIVRIGATISAGVGRAQVAGLVSGGPAEQAGLRTGDLIVAAEGEQVSTDTRFIEIIRAHGTKPLAIEIERDGQRRTITVTPRSEDVVDIGANLRPIETISIKPGIAEAFKLSVERNWEWTALIFETIQGLITRETPVKQLMGPVGIAGLSGEAAEAGWIQLFTVMALISLNLGIMNLMPIPVLDGGHIAILAVEGLSRRDFSMKVKEKMLLAGFVLLVTLMVTVIYNDLTRVTWIEPLMPWR